MHFVHLIKSENINIYKKLREFYEKEDFSTYRTPLEANVELELIRELAESNPRVKPAYDELQKKDGESRNYLEILNSMDSKTIGFSSLSNKMESLLNSIIEIAESK